ncbi:MAG: 1-acyl-sn-glycerol-3-phosphate acyltransferase [Nannocystaceae bacterium]
MTSTAAAPRTRFARALAWIWFRSLQREGAAVPPGPTLWVLNHPNGLLDAVVATAALPGSPRFLGKATLWQVLVLKPLLAIFDPIPVHRRADGDVGPDATAKTFAAVHEALARGDAVAIFPEGISHARRELAPLKTGAARMVLSSPRPVQLVPAGLVYGERERFRHSALVRVGTPIDYDDLRGRGAEPDAVATLTGRIAEQLRPLTLHGPDDAAQALAERLAWLLAEGPRERAALAPLQARVATLATRLRALPPASLAAIETRATQACDALARAGVRADQLGFAYDRATVARWLPGFASRLLFAPLWLPLALWCWPVYRLTGFVIGRLVLDLDVVATYKFLLGLVLFPAWLCASLVLAGVFGGVAGVLATLVAAAVAFVVLPLGERVGEDLQAIRGFAQRRNPRLQALAQERDALLAAFPELRDGGAPPLSR